MPSSAADLRRSLEIEAGYLAGPGLAAAGFLAHRLGKPLLLEGSPGVGKTEFAMAMAKILGATLERVQCYPGLEASQVLYEWNFPAQMIAARTTDGSPGGGKPNTVWTEEYLIARPVLRALQHRRAVLLIDEIDRADDDLEALLLEVLDKNEISIPELRTIKAGAPPFVVLTSNRTREVHDAVKRRCLYHWIDHPSAEGEAQILRRRVDHLPPEQAVDIAAAMRTLRRLDLVKPPSMAEAIDYARSRVETGNVEEALSAIVKHHDDEAEVRAVLMPGGS